MRVVNKAVKDGIGVGRIADNFVPGRDGKLTGDNCGAAAVAVFEYLEKIMACLVIERLQAPIVQYQELNVTKSALKPGIPAIAVR